MYAVCKVHRFRNRDWIWFPFQKSAAKKAFNFCLREVRNRGA